MTKSEIVGMVLMLAGCAIASESKVENPLTFVFIGSGIAVVGLVIGLSSTIRKLRNKN
jgi:hypothetical protein